MNNPDENTSRNSSSYEFAETSLERAVSYLEELANYDQADATQDFILVVKDTVSLSITAFWSSQHEAYRVSEEALSSSFNSLQSLCTSYAARVEIPSGFSHNLIFADVVPNPTSIPPDWGTIVISHTIVIGIGLISQPPVILPCTFGVSDVWRWGDMQGLCSNGQPTYSPNSDAAKEIAKRLNKPACQSTSRCKWYKNITTPFFIPPNGCPANSNDITPNDNSLDYLLFYNNAGSPNYHLCLSQAEMNFYLNGTKTVTLLNKPSGFDVISYYMTGTLITSIPNSAVHVLEPTYGQCGSGVPTL